MASLTKEVSSWYFTGLGAAICRVKRRSVRLGIGSLGRLFAETLAAPFTVLP